MSAVASEATDVCEPIAVQLLGGVSVRVDDREMRPRDIGGTKVRHLRLALLFADGVAVPRDELISILWPAERGSACSATLETYICPLRSRTDAVSARSTTRAPHLDRGRRPALPSTSTQLQPAVLTR
ncbi:MAG: hypothetical protein ACKOVB_15455 [Terrabacter sp.]